MAVRYQAGRAVPLGQSRKTLVYQEMERSMSNAYSALERVMTQLHQLRGVNERAGDTLGVKQAQEALSDIRRALAIVEEAHMTVADRTP